MNRLPLGALALLAATQVAGCIITSDNTDDEARITVNWELRNVGSNVLAPCPPGYDTMALYSQPVDANGNDIGSPIIDLFRCNDGTGVSAPLPPTTYLSWIEVTNTNNTAQYARSLGAYVDVTVEDKTLDAAIFLNGGYFQVDWNLKSASTESPLQCSTTPDLNGIEITAFIASPGDAGEFPPFPCEDHTAVTPVLPARFYSVVIQAVNAGGFGRSEGIQLDNREIRGPNIVTDLGLVTLPIYDL